MGIQAIVSVGVGLLGLALGALGLVAGSGAVSNVLSLLVVAVASGSLWLGWRLSKDEPTRRRRANANRRSWPYA